MKDNLYCTDHDLGTSKVLLGLKICCLNIDSFVKHFDELKVFTEAQTPHIFGINETKHDDTVTDEELRIETIMTLFGRIETDTEVEWLFMCINLSYSVSLRK